MDEAARRYARRILLVHLGVLLGVIGIVAIAAREVYQQTRRQSVEQAVERQELLAWQAGRGIESYYGSIINNLDLIQRGEENEENRFLRLWLGRQAFAMAPVLWHQLEGGVSHMFGVVRPENRVVAVFPREKTKEAEEAAGVAGEALSAVERVTVLPLQQIGGDWAHMVCVPTAGGGNPARRPGAREGSARERGGEGVDGEGRMLLVAVVPAVKVQERFLSNVQDGVVSARFVDGKGRVIASSGGEGVGMNLISDGGDPRLAALLRAHVSAHLSGTAVIEETTRMQGREITPRIVSVEKVEVADQSWAVVISSPLSEVDALVDGVFRRAIFWAGFVVVAVTATLLSTAMYMIRGRLRMERVQTEMLNKELSQARQIQLAWLPEGKGKISSVDLAAVNKPASHISGDFYDWFELPDGRLVVTIGDVTGHGMGAAFLMGTAQLLIRTTMPRVKDPGRCLAEVNRQLCTQVFNGQFVTALIVVLDVDEGVMEAASAGHFPPLLRDESGVKPMEVEGELVLGVDPESVYRTVRFELPEAYGLLLYTDGATDALGVGGERFKIERLIEAASAEAGSAEQMVRGVVESVVEFQGTAAMSDDLTLVAIRGGDRVRRMQAVQRESVVGVEG